MQPRIALLTPEGVPLTLAIGPWPQRLIAFTIDALVMLVLIALIGLFLAVLGAGPLPDGHHDGQLGTSLKGLGAFIVSKFYFILFELRWDGQTPGKRLVGLRAVIRGGGRMTLGHVIARNLTRDLETLIPLMTILTPSAFGIEEGPQRLLAWLWLVSLSGLPLLNRYRLRLGDLLGDTVVVAIPAPLLLDDLERALGERGDAVHSDRFTSAQLALYGAAELQTLEALLRRNAGRADGARDDDALLEAIAARVTARLASAEGEPSPLEQPAPPADPAAARRFLEDFYRAHRRWLERRRLDGHRD